MTAASGTSVVGEMEGHYTAAMRFGVALIVPGGHWHSGGGMGGGWMDGFLGARGEGSCWSHGVGLALGIFISRFYASKR